MIIVICIIFSLILAYIKYNKFSENFKMINITPDIYVINLEHDKERFYKIKNQAENQNIKVIRFDAINGKKLKVHNKTINTIFSRNNNLKNAQIGCALSHIYIWNIIKKSNKEFAIIFEDDSVIPKNFYNKLNNYMSELPKNWDMLFLGGNSFQGKKYSKNLLIPVKNLKGNYGLFAYIIKKDFALKLLKSCRNLMHPIDYHLNLNFYDKHNIFYCYPEIIRHDYNNYSNIMQKRRDGESKKRENTIILD